MVRKVKWYSPTTKQSIISSQPTFLTNRVTDWLCGDNEHSRPEKENDARSPHAACKVLYVAQLVNARPDTRDFDSKRTPLFVEYRTRRLWFSGIEKHSVS